MLRPEVLFKTFLGVGGIGYTFKPVGLLKSHPYNQITFTTPFKKQSTYAAGVHQRFFFPCFVFGQDSGKYGIILVSLDNYTVGGQESRCGIVGNSEIAVTVSTNDDSYNVVTITTNSSGAYGWLHAIIPWVALTPNCYVNGAYSGGDFS